MEQTLARLRAIYHAVGGAMIDYG